MKDDFIALSWAGAFALMFAGFLLGEAYKDHDIIYVLLAVLLLLSVRSDARTGFISGTYERGWFAWKKTSGSLSLPSDQLGGKK